MVQTEESGNGRTTQSTMRRRKAALTPSSAAEPAPPRNEDDTNSFSFSLLDILRMLLGIVVLNLLISYFFTSSWTYGYSGKLIQPHFLRHQLFGTRVSLNESQLSLYNGTDPDLPIYIAINGTVWDVSINKGTYGVGGSYSFFSGRDCARALATNCLNHLTHDIRDITPEERRRLSGWIEWFDDKYFRVGEVIHEAITGSPPSRIDCTGKYHH